MFAKSLSDHELQLELRNISADAMKVYIQMSGSSYTPEEFIKNYCAIELRKRHKLFITLETSRSDIIEYFSSFDKLNIINQMKIDMLIYDPVGEYPSDSRLRAIVEFKVNANCNLINADISRTSKLLEWLEGEARPVEGSRFGYQIVCTAYSPNDSTGIDRDNMSKLCQPTRNASELEYHSFCIDYDRNGKVHCAVIGMKVTPLKTQPTQ